MVGSEPGQPGQFRRPWTFAHFAVWYDLDTTRGDATEPTSGRQPRAQLQNGLGWVRLRRKQACLRIPVQTVESHGDYYSLLLLYVPWRRETEDILQGHGSAMEAVLARQNEMVVLNAENHSFAEEVQRAVVQLQALEDDAYQDTVAPMAQQVQREDANQPTVEAKGGILNPEHTVDPSWLEGTNGEYGTVNADTLHDDDDAIGALSRQTLSERDYQQLVLSLNEHQRVPFDRVVRYTRELHQYNIKVHDDPPEAFHLFVTGGAGTGKSHVIKAIKEYLERSVSGGLNKHACMLMAPTGVAAFNIGGLTIHRALQLQVEHGRLARQISLGALALHDLRDLWKGVHTIIIDEVSMVSYQILKSIHSRLCEIYANDEIFGGLNVIAVGNFYQLSPVIGFKWPGNASDQSKPGELPVEVYVRFLDPNVEQLSRVPVFLGEQNVPIRPISARFYGKEGTLLQRTQIPLILCWAATVHKVQGLSLNAAVIDLGVNVLEPGMAYVALSRVRTLGGLALLNFEPSKVKANESARRDGEIDWSAVEDTAVKLCWVQSIRRNGS